MTDKTQQCDDFQHDILGSTAAGCPTCHRLRSQPAQTEAQSKPEGISDADWREAYMRVFGEAGERGQMADLLAHRDALEISLHRQLRTALSERNQLQAENANLRGAMKAQDEREEQAAQRIGMVHSCDWPYDAAEEILSLRAQLERLRSAAKNVLRYREDEDRIGESPSAVVPDELMGALRSALTPDATAQS